MDEGGCVMDSCDTPSFFSNYAKVAFFSYLHA